jgi:hypothetical protein
MARKTPQLNLAPEKRQVLSSDFNLFYKPQVKPEIAGAKELYSSLNNFVNDAGQKMVIASEVREKKVSEAQAIKDYNKNRTDFNTRVNNGTLPKEANPYFIDKYKELELNTKAQIFQNQLGTRYAELKIAEQPSPTAFQEFYEKEIKKYVADNNLGAYKPTDLEKGFFQKTSGFKNQLFQTHVSSQMSNISEQYKINFQNNIQGMFDESKSFAEIGETVSAFILDKTANGLSNGSAQKYLLETLTDYAEKTGDFEYAEKLLEELPKHIQLGTGKLGDIKGLKDDLFQIKDKLQDRATKEIQDANTRQSAIRQKEFGQALTVADKYTTFNEAKENDPNWDTYSNYKKDKLRKIFDERKVGFGSQTEIGVEETINELITTGKYDEAREFLVENQSRMQPKFYKDYKNVIDNYETFGEDPLLNSQTYRLSEERLDDIVQNILDTAKGSMIKVNVKATRKLDFRHEAIEWLASHPIDTSSIVAGEQIGFSKSERREKFKAWVKKRYQEEEADLREAMKNQVGFPDDNSKENNNSEIIVNPDELKQFEAKNVTFENNTTAKAKPKNTYGFTELEIAERRTDLKEMNSANFQSKYKISKEMFKKSIGEMK